MKNISNYFIVFFFSIILLSSSVAFVAPADALKSSGNPTKKFGSETGNIVCGDKLCSEVEQEAEQKTTSEQSFSFGGMIDTVPPLVIIPSDFSVTTADSAGAVVMFSVKAIDDVDEIVDATCSSVSGRMFAVGDTTVTCSASDLSGNESIKSFNVNVVFDPTGGPIAGTQSRTTNYSGMWIPPNPISYSCALGVFSIDLVSLEIADNNPEIMITPHFSGFLSPFLEVPLLHTILYDGSEPLSVSTSGIVDASPVDPDAPYIMNISGNFVDGSTLQTNISFNFDIEYQGLSVCDVLNEDQVFVKSNAAGTAETGESTIQPAGETSEGVLSVEPIMTSRTFDLSGEWTAQSPTGSSVRLGSTGFVLSEITIVDNNPTLTLYANFYPTVLTGNVVLDSNSSELSFSGILDYVHIDAAGTVVTTPVPILLTGVFVDENTFEGTISAVGWGDSATVIITKNTAATEPILEESTIQPAGETGTVETSESTIQPAGETGTVETSESTIQPAGETGTVDTHNLAYGGTWIPVGDSTIASCFNYPLTISQIEIGDVNPNLTFGISFGGQASTLVNMGILQFTTPLYNDNDYISLPVPTSQAGVTVFVIGQFAGENSFDATFDAIFDGSTGSSACIPTKKAIHFSKASSTPTITQTPDVSLADSDGDGLSDEEEYYYGTQIDVADSDGDGVSDYDEAVYGTDPLSPDDYPQIPEPSGPQPSSETTTGSTLETTSVDLPDWITNVAEFWCNSEIDDSGFVEAIQYLIDNGVIVVPPTETGVSTGEPIPDWIKNNACWWAGGQISDAEFANGIQFLIQIGSIVIAP